jgi:hypothetical protein
VPGATRLWSNALGLMVVSLRGSRWERPMSKEHPAAYAMELKRSWRVVVPVRGKLTPRICREKFTCRAEALTWMNTAEGHQAIASARGGNAFLCQPCTGSHRPVG